MKLIKRNIPIFVIGGLTALIFIAIIVASQKKPPVSPNLTEVDETELISGHTYIHGNPNAVMTLVEFSDFACPACKLYFPVISNLRKNYSNYIKIAYRHFPLPQYPNSKKAAIAAQVAGEQGKFWEYHDVLYENQQNMEEETLFKYAQQLNLDLEKFKNDYYNGNFNTLVDDDIKTAHKLGVNATPTFYLNGKLLNAKSAQDLESYITGEIEKQQPATEPQPITQPDKTSDTEPEAEGQKLPVLEISYTEEDGFIPKETQALLGQKVRWTNNSDREIKIIQSIKKFDEFKDGLIIKPAESFELELYEGKLWTYKEEQSQTYGSIFIFIPN